jgi:RNA polymerase sigma factor (sigma-70 family)
MSSRRGEGSVHRRQLFDELYAEQHAALHAFFLARTSDRETALDLLQELFLRAWRNLASLDALPPARRPLWLFSVARNLVVDHYRTRGSREAAYSRFERFTPPAHADAAEDEAIVADQLRLLDAAIWRLPDELRDPLVLHVLGACSSAQIGELLGRPAGTVRYHLAQARQRLAAELQLAHAEDS